MADASLSGSAPVVVDAWPEVDFAKYGEVEQRPLSRIRHRIIRRLSRNWVVIPHVTHHDLADITALEEYRQRLNLSLGEGETRVTLTALLILGTVRALQEFPSFNASLTDDSIVVKKYFNIGVATDTPKGLVVPVLRHADQMGLHEIAAELSALVGLARAGRLLPEQMAGGTFSISSLGGIGGRAFTPIINAPEVAILGTTRTFMGPVWDGDAFLPRLMLPLSLSYDHRVVDGADAARFTVRLAEILGRDLPAVPE